MRRISLLVEGQTERAALPLFLSRWLASRLDDPPDIMPVTFKGSGDYRKNYARRATREFGADDCIGVVGLMDLYGSGLEYPPDASPGEKRNWAKKALESEVEHDRFRQHFALHETEAWLLSDPTIFPGAIRGDLPSTDPEDVDFDNHPATRLATLFWTKLGRKYRKTIDGVDLFSRLGPELAAAKCPHLQLLLDDLLELARGA